MKAFFCTKYGDPEDIELRETEIPTPVNNEVLIEVKAAPINDYDWCVTRGKPFAYRFFFGLMRPGKKFQRLGMEVAGIVKEIGPDVKSFKPGDRVYGDTSYHSFGSFAEHLNVSEEALNHLPDAISFDEAAALPHASELAYQGLISNGEIQNEMDILINGAGGGMGTFGLQLAKEYNAHVTGVDSGEKLDKMEALGFDSVIDYKQTDFTRNGIQYDLILDAKSTRSPFSLLKSLKPNGKYVTVGGQTGKILQVVFFKRFIKWFTSKSVYMVGLRPNQNQKAILKLYQEGKLRSIVDGPYPLEEAPQRIRYFGEGKHTGKVILNP